MSGNQHHSNMNFAPMGCLSEHLDYFNDNIACNQPILHGDFDDIFNQDFDLVFDPVFMMDSDAATVARPYNPQPEPQPHYWGKPQHHAREQVQVQTPPVPVIAYSSSFVPPTKGARSNPYAPPATPAAAPKPIIHAPIQKLEPAEVSPTSVTAVFESIPAPIAVAKSSPRKRTHSMVVSPPEPEPVPCASTDISNLSFQEQEDLRRERNRHHAKRSRQRKRSYMSSLEEAVHEMRKENERLFDLLGMDSRKAKADMALEEERKKAIATEKFVAGLKQPRNRVLDNTTLAFLRELWK